LTKRSRDRSRDEVARKAEADRKGKRIVGGWWMVLKCCSGLFFNEQVCLVVLY
jgi:hypothetical protein